jgi:hypothetical protein
MVDHSVSLDIPGLYDLLRGRKTLVSPMRLYRRRPFNRFVLFVVTFLVAGLVPPNLDWKSAFAMDCTGSCRAAYEWTGGTIGNQNVIDVPYRGLIPSGSYVNCMTGCTQVWRGIWSKNSDSTRYIFLGIETTQTTNYYFYGIWRPNKAFEWRPVESVPDADRGNRVNLITYVAGDGVHVVVNSGSIYRDMLTLMEDRIFWQLQVGYRIWAADNTVKISTFRSNNHMWQCGCDGRWWYQGSDPRLLSGNSRMVQAWEVPVHVSSTGGTYQAYCGTGQNDQAFCT